MVSKAFRVIGEGLADADRWFADIVAQSIGCTKPEAYAVVAYYVRHKLAKADHIGRRYHVKHGALFEPEAFRKALDLVKAG